MFTGVFLTVLNLLSIVYAYNFTTGSATQCDDFSVQWTGGSPPFQLLLIPTYGVPHNITVPDTAFSNGQGSYTFAQLPYKEGRKLVLTMSDSTGFGSGGASEALTVGAAKNGGNCDTRERTPDFFYDLPSSLQQCRPYQFVNYTGATQPVRIIGVIPGGDIFTLNPPSGSTSYTWPAADIYNGTSVIFAIVDAQSRQGGSSDLIVVTASGDASCINAQSPTSTITSSSTSPTSTTSTAPTISQSASGGTPIALIAATVMGSLILLAVAVTLGLFYLKKRKDAQRPWTGTGPRLSFRAQSQTNLDLAGDSSERSSPYHYSSRATYMGGDSAHPLFSPSPHLDSQSLSPVPYTASSHSNPDPFNPLDASTEPDPFTARDSLRTSMSTAQRKAALAGATTYKPSRFILHTDIEDALPPDTGEEIVELPPQYSERRATPTPSTRNSQQPSYNHPPL